MHPILFRIPLPQLVWHLWWGLALLAVGAVAFAVFALRQGERQLGLGALAVGAVLAILGVVYRDTTYAPASIPVLSYGVMLGLALVLGWFLSLRMAEQDGLPRESMANCYLITAAVAFVGARLVYLITNSSEFAGVDDVINVRHGGYSAYGGFFGGLLGSWLYLRTQKLSLLRWADAAAPSVALGVFVARIGCYLFGCDFGRRLDESAPAWLAHLGSFPHWQGATLDAGDGAPAFVHQRNVLRGSLEGARLATTEVSYPVHATQIYEALAGLALFGVLLWARKHTRFRGQVFLLLALGYGAARFVVESFRGEPERRDFGPLLAPHVAMALGLAVLGAALAFSVTSSIAHVQKRRAAQVLAFLPALLVAVLGRPAEFVTVPAIQYSVNQWLALGSAVVAAYFYVVREREAEPGRARA